MTDDVREQTTPLAVKETAIAGAGARKRFEFLIDLIDLINIEKIIDNDVAFCGKYLTLRVQSTLITLFRVRSDRRLRDRSLR